MIPPGSTLRLAFLPAPELHPHARTAFFPLAREEYEATAFQLFRSRNNT